MGLLGGLRRPQLQPFAMIGLRNLCETRRERRRLFAVVSGSQDLRDAYTEWAAIEFEKQVSAGVITIAAEEGEQGVLLRFLQFILDNQDSIIAFIAKLVAIFNGGPLPMQADVAAAVSADSASLAAHSVVDQLSGAVEQLDALVAREDSFVERLQAVAQLVKAAA